MAGFECFKFTASIKGFVMEPNTCLHFDFLCNISHQISIYKILSIYIIQIYRNMKPTTVLNTTRIIVEVIINAESSADAISDFENCISKQPRSNAYLKTEFSSKNEVKARACLIIRQGNGHCTSH